MSRHNCCCRFAIAQKTFVAAAQKTFVVAVATCALRYRTDKQCVWIRICVWTPAERS
ncbi:hypothetical protein ACIQXF_03910 [Lysinibacillus sp. NPDC097231]|uniref:hypothetical protein n=1 Tax=Lysinibacillus sp. NPDC097231 TaxID=3364142 RepID=UPI0038027A25